MKHKFWIVLLTILSTLCISLGLVACGDNSGNSEQGGKTDHTHTYGVDNTCTECGAKLKYSEGLEFELSDDGNSYSVSGIGSAQGKIIVPYGYNGKPITAINSEAFYQNDTTLISIDLPEGLTTIGDYAFTLCTKLASITIPKSLTTIGAQAFVYCVSLKSIAIPENLTFIGEFAFNASGLEKFEVSENNSVYSGQGGVLYNKAKTQIIAIPPAIKGNITIPDSITTIDSNWLTILGTLPYIESITISENSTAYSSQDGILYDKAKTQILAVPKGIKGNLTLPNGLTTIDSYAFSGCSSLTSVTLPNGLTTIGNSAFSGCSSLTSVTIGNSVTSIGDHAFDSCTSLESVTIPDSVTSIGRNAFEGCTSLTSIVIPNKVDTITISMFENCTSLKSVIIPKSVRYISNSAFEGCTSLKNVEIPVQVEGIGVSAFRDCTSLKSVIIKTTGITSSDRFEHIGPYAFENCTSLEIIILPYTVNYIGRGAFYGCTKLKVYYEDSSDYWDKIDLDGSNDNLTGNVYFYSSTAKYGCWHYNRNDEPELW